jgi:hypothetical protein
MTGFKQVYYLPRLKELQEVSGLAIEGFYDWEIKNQVGAIKISTQLPMCFKWDWGC